MRNLSLRMVTFLYRLVSARSSSTIKGFQFQISQSFPSYALSGHFQLIYGALASTKLSVIWRQHLNTIFYFLACKGIQLQWDLLDFVSWQGIWGVSREWKGKCGYDGEDYDDNFGRCDGGDEHNDSSRDGDVCLHLLGSLCPGRSYKYFA